MYAVTDGCHTWERRVARNLFVRPPWAVLKFQTLRNRKQGTVEIESFWT